MNKRNSRGQFLSTGRFKKQCLVCNKIFQVIYFRKNSAKFCSQKCSQIYHAGKNHHQFNKSRSKKTCQKIANTLKGKMVGSKAPGWKGGIQHHTSGYILIYSPKHPFCNKQKYVFEHRLIAEKHISRYLKRNEIVHHINEIKDDNRPKNLYIMTITEHKHFHQLKIKPILKSNLINYSK